MDGGDAETLTTVASLSAGMMPAQQAAPAAPAADPAPAAPATPPATPPGHAPAAAVGDPARRPPGIPKRVASHYKMVHQFVEESEGDRPIHRWVGGDTGRLM